MSVSASFVPVSSVSKFTTAESTSTEVTTTPGTESTTILGTNTRSDTTMYVVKRSGKIETVSFDKILERVRRLTSDTLMVDGQTVPCSPLLRVNCHELAIKIIGQLCQNMTTTQIDELTAYQCASQSALSPEHGVLAARIVETRHHKNTDSSFLAVTEKLYRNQVLGEPAPMVSDTYYNDVLWYAAEGADKTLSDCTVKVAYPGVPGFSEIRFDTLDGVCQHGRDFDFDYFGFKTMENAYLAAVSDPNNTATDAKKVLVERPQHMWLRVAIGIHGRDVARVLETYHYMSTRMFIHATPTLFNSGTPHPQLSSCFLLQMEADSIKGIYNTLSDCAEISKHAGGIGVAVSTVRAKGASIRGTGGVSNGLVPMCRVFETTAQYVDQGGGKRNGSFAMYIEPWHADIAEFVTLGLKHGAEKKRARDLFYAIWVPDLFMRRMQNKQPWTLMCPRACPGLTDVWGDEFDALYERYEREGRGSSTVDAREIWLQILKVQMETGAPYIVYKDRVNRCSNQMNVGTIKSSNLCAEIMEYTDSEESAVCNLASIGLPAFVDVATGKFDHEKLAHIAGVIAQNLDRVIDVNYNPTEKTRTSNHRHRPVAIGIQGLADVFAMLGFSFESKEARKLNMDMQESIYWGSLVRSADMAEKDGPYSTFWGSPASKGLLQFDLQGKTDLVAARGRYDWDALKKRIATTGLRNSLLVALMPTASTAQILGYNECFEPFTSNIYSRRTLAGDFTVVNRHLVKELVARNLWSDAMATEILSNWGSVQSIERIPADVRERFKTAWEIKMKAVIDLAADRGIFVCQSQSMNVWMEDPDFARLTSLHMYGWQQGLKTGSYYVRRRPKNNAQQFAVDPSMAEKFRANANKEEVRPEPEENGCLSCSA